MRVAGFAGGSGTGTAAAVAGIDGGGASGETGTGSRSGDGASARRAVHCWSDAAGCDLGEAVAPPTNLEWGRGPGATGCLPRLAKSRSGACNLGCQSSAE